MQRTDLDIILAASARHIGRIVERRGQPHRLNRSIAFEQIRSAAFRHGQVQREIAALLSTPEPAEIAGAREGLAHPEAIPASVRASIVASLRSALDAYEETRAARLSALRAEVFSSEEIDRARATAEERVSATPSTDYQRAAWAAYPRARVEGVDLDDARALGLLSYLVAPQG